MRTHYSKILKIGLVVFLLAAFIFPSQSQAAWLFGNKNKQKSNQEQKSNNSEGKNQGENKNSNGGFCARINDIKILDKIAERESKIDSRRDNRQDNFTEKMQTRDENRLKNRLEWDANREAQFKKLEETAKTEVQKEAVAEFKSAVLAAISARRTAIDSAISTFRTEVKNAQDSRKSSVNSVFSSYKNAISVALEKAKSDCEDGVEPSTVKTTFQASVKEARDKTVNDRKSIDKIKTTIDSLIASKKQAIEKAIANFKTAMEIARTKLKAAFTTTNTTE